MSHSVIDALFDQLEASINKDAGTPLSDGAAPIYIYGAGNVGKDVFRVLKRHGLTVAGFLDRSGKPGAAWEGAPIFLPDDPALSSSERKRSHVVIGLFNYLTDAAAIETLLASLGYGRVSSFAEIHDRYGAELGDRYWMTSRAVYRAEKERIVAAYEILSDEPSRKLFTQVLRSRFLKDASALPAPDPATQYFPPGLPAWPSPVRFVDCGAFDGDTLRQFIERGLPIEAIAAFEPDPANFRQLAKCISSEPFKSTTSCLFPCGVGATLSQVRFSAGFGTGSQISDQGEIMIQCVSLDESLAGFRPNMIKMDIEGAEYDALVGAKQIIEEHRPALAICVYHRADHLWSIPLLAEKYLGGARHYLRLHAYHALDLVNYVLP